MQGGRSLKSMGIARSSIKDTCEVVSRVLVSTRAQQYGNQSEASRRGIQRNVMHTGAPGDEAAGIRQQGSGSGHQTAGIAQRHAVALTIALPDWQLFGSCRVLHRPPQH